MGKPDSRIFQIALDQLGIEPESAVMAGNNLETGIAGVQNCGIKTVWVNRHDAEPLNVVQPDLEIKQISALPAVLQTLGSVSREHRQQIN